VKVVLVRRILLATVAATSLVLAGCGGSSDSGGGGLDDIKVSSAKTPKVTVDKGFKATKTTSRVVKKGGGEEVANGDSIKISLAGVNGTTGKQFDSTYATGKPVTLTLGQGMLPGFVKGLVGQKIGSRVLVAIPPKDGFGDQGQSTYNIKKNDTMVFLFDLVAKVPNEASGVSKNLPKDLPKLTLDADKHPAGFTKTKTMDKKKTKESADVVIQGKGAKVKSGQALTVQYVGQVYPTGAVFDESWSKQPTSFQIGGEGLIKCWNDTLVGQNIGSRVVIVCPPDTAYGNKPPAGSKIGKGDTLIFAVDLLDAS
jgi:peptidylprolyl isomerase